MNTKTLKERLKSQSNDYSYFEKTFLKSTEQHLVNKRNYSYTPGVVLKSLSIIIPYYNSSVSLVFLLESLQKQKNVDFKKVEVIVVDDGSDKELKLKKKYNFKVDIIRIRKNKGRVRVRNLGMLMASNDIIMFLDADMILHESLLYNHLLVHSVFGENDSCLLVGYREWVDKKDKRLYKRKVLLEDVDLCSDYRIKVTFEKKHLPYITNKNLLGKTLYIAQETDYYKKLGCLKSYFGFKLYQQIHGFLFSLPKELVLRAGPVGETKKGWGSDDVMLVARFIAAGAKVIPLLNSRSMHLYNINGGRSEKQNVSERRVNVLKFKRQLQEPFIEFVE